MAPRTGLPAIPAFDDQGAIHVVVESPRGCTSKLKHDPSLGAMTLSRPLPHGLAYPHDWGFVPSTTAADGDPFDAMVLWDDVTYPGVVLTCRAIGVLLVEQTNKQTGRRERNDRLAVLPVDAPRWAAVKTIDDLGDRVREELAHFFAAAVEFEGKDLKVLGWRGPAEAERLLRQSMAGSSRRKRSGMAKRSQGAAARRNVKKAAASAKRKRTIAHLPKKTRTALGKKGAAAAKRKKR